jgi:hypothetical protein
MQFASSTSTLQELQPQNQQHAVMSVLSGPGVNYKQNPSLQAESASLT